MAGIEKRVLGRTGLPVTVLGFGTTNLSGRRRNLVSGETAGRILNTALDAGINFFDSALDYGHAEERIGQHISKRRAEFYIATKCGCDPHGTPSLFARLRHRSVIFRRPGFGHVFTPDNVRTGLEESLRRMKTDYVDLVQFHGHPTRAELEVSGTVETLLDLKKQGKLRWIGASAEQPELRDLIDWGVFDVFQIPYSALEREHEDLITAAAAKGAGVIIRGGVAQGAPGKEQGQRWENWQRARLDDLIGDMPRMEFMLRFTISHPAMHTTIVGTTKLEHLQDNIDATLKGPLPPDMYEAAKRRLLEAGFTPKG